MTIKDLIANKDSYILPAIQRTFVWEEDQICKLFDSVFQRFPIGNFLIWQISGEDASKKGIDFYNFLPKYDEYNNTGNTRVENPVAAKTYYAVLDGQQRTQAFILGLSGSLKLKLKHRRKDNANSYREKYLYINLIPELEEDSEFKYELMFLADEELKEQPEKSWYKLGKILSCSDIPRFKTVQNDIIGKKDFTEEEKDIIDENLSIIYNRIMNDENIIQTSTVDKDKTLDEVLDIFVRTNSGGTVLNKTDLIFSTIVTSWNEGREKIEDLITNLNNVGGRGDRFNFNKDFVIRCIFYLLDEPTTLNVKNIKKNIETIKKKWDGIEESILCIRDIFSKLGFRDDNLTSLNVAMPVAYFKYKGGDTNDETSLKELRKYIIIAQMKKLLGVASASTLTNVRAALVDDNLRLKSKIFKLSQLGNVHIVGDRDFLISESDIDDWFELEKGPYTYMLLTLLYDTKKFNDNVYHQDHMHPETLLKKTKYKKNRNLLANLQLLGGPENESKNKTEFEKWEKQERRKNGYKDPYLDDNISRKIKDYPAFLANRKSNMKKHLMDILDVKPDPKPEKSRARKS